MLNIRANVPKRSRPLHKNPFLFFGWAVEMACAIASEASSPCRQPAFHREANRA